jgi:hypothetical protein
MYLETARSAFILIGSSTRHQSDRLLGDSQLSDGLCAASPSGTGATKNRARRSLCSSGKLIAQTGRSMTQMENRA